MEQSGLEGRFLRRGNYGSPYPLSTREITPPVRPGHPGLDARRPAQNPAFPPKIQRTGVSKGMAIRRSTRTLALMAALGLAACATTVPKPVPAPPPAPAVQPAPVLPPPPSPGDAKFEAFLAQMRVEALAQGIAPETFDSATKDIAPVPTILAMNANQPEFSKPVWGYLDSAVSARRIRDAQFMLSRYGEALDKIAAQSGVTKEILVAVWGMESDFGADSGGFNLFAALATLAYDGPRAAYARPEFLAALHIYQDRHYAVSEMVGSWAGAFGQTQFTPTNFLKYASDGDGDGAIDLWHSPPDALASAAKLLTEQGWVRGQAWGYEVILPDGFLYEDADLDIQKPVSEWSA